MRFATISETDFDEIVSLIYDLAFSMEPQKWGSVPGEKEANALDEFKKKLFGEPIGD